MKIFCKISEISLNIKAVCNFQSMKSPVEQNSFLSKLFCYITWFVISPHQMRHWTTYRPGLYVKSFCFFETIAQQFKNYKLKKPLIYVYFEISLTYFKGTQNYQHILILFTPQLCSYVNLIKVICYLNLCYVHKLKLISHKLHLSSAHMASLVNQ